MANRKRAKCTRSDSIEAEDLLRDREKLFGTSLDDLLQAHSYRASEVADKAAIMSMALLDFLCDKKTKQPELALGIVERLEKLRCSATDDLRRTATLVNELKQPPVRITAVLADDHQSIQLTGSAKVLPLRKGRRQMIEASKE